MGVGIKDIQQNCLECGRSCSNRRSLANHVARSHLEIGLMKGYVIKHVLHGILPKCLCGCDNVPSWNKVYCQFNDYINGHNPTGFKVAQPIFTKEQIEKRNVAIKKAYVERANEIKNKISKSVSKGLRDSEFDFSTFRKELWQDAEYKEKQHISRIDSWAGEIGDKRKEQVFSKEFIKKRLDSIAANNTPTRNSKQELMFVERLKNVFGVEEVVSQKWFNFDEKTWCADVWLPSSKTIIEFDGIYHHGLDRASDFTIGQLVHIANDLKKNRIAKEKDLNFIRVKSDVDLEKITSLAELKALSYHLVEQGNVIKDSTFKIDETNALISRDELVKLLQTNEGKETIEQKVLPCLTNLFNEHVKTHGWFYPETSEKLENVLESLSHCEPISNKTLKSNNVGSAWLKAFGKSYWNVDAGPVKAFQDEKKLQSVLSYRLGLNNSKPYTYTLRDGSTLTSNEAFDINLKNVRYGFIVQRNCVSWFRPIWAAQIYKTFLKDIPNPVVWDPSVGFSARMLAFAAICKNGKFIGTDPSSAMIADAKRLVNEFSSLRTGLVFDLKQEGSEQTNIESSSLDLVFTSPPYFDKEKYYDEPGQCWRDHNTLDKWITLYLRPTLMTISRAIKQSGSVIINIDHKNVDIVVKEAEFCELRLVDTLKIYSGHDHFSRKVGHTEKGRHEPVLVFQKR